MIAFFIITERNYKKGILHWHAVAFKMMIISILGASPYSFFHSFIQEFHYTVMYLYMKNKGYTCSFINSYSSSITALSCSGLRWTQSTGSYPGNTGPKATKPEWDVSPLQGIRHTCIYTLIHTHR